MPLWSSRNRTETVTCLACGDDVVRDEAREYDKHGDRWDRDDKAFEHVCKSCHGDLCHQPRDELEELLVELEAGERSQEAFLLQYFSTVADRYGTLEEGRE
ncbi:DUF7562 family protein [Natronobacterium gregoryi]|uniref:Small CPxCG-related zinc finger protein n=2 Tax=Natronobacterium gregoryi TaxID=44930 RepID=L0ANZ4_NATGS|nr:hypothetical protein [Natronobacterium gregoryi]AFZ74805.1 hypothetical protein Natgr_3699 [Natronobacterium gregoryi SP2]ELY66137.1 hypothetical protein C490_13274 [Natronobacterium gregoryi SP2]PLK19488.1 hypothetical protein CYV19_14610 [Natronobacterium gregoryi SP2]SFJ43458.1 hypothetical protein SAMN05443661_12923 [Natronobacterium gregoryi]